jgi:FtsP/CotA-like multicopper oxidase with cupredoxin domain
MRMTVAKTTIEAATKVDRRAFLRGGGFTVAGALTPSVFAADALRSRALRRRPAKADYTLKIEPSSIEIAPGVGIKTTAYNGQVPGPILRMRQRQ